MENKEELKINLNIDQEKLERPKLISERRQGQPLISLQNVTKIFHSRKQKKVAVNNISFDINRGENLALLGANGAGKTTTVEMIAGINTPTSGKISYLYDYINTFQEGIGIQFQDSSYPSGLKVRDIIEFVANAYNFSVSKEWLNEIIDGFALRDLYKKNARSLSGGQQQRLNVLLSIIHKPKVVFLDELTTGLDISAREKIVNFVKKYIEQNEMTAVLVSHNIEEINALCDRIIIMQNGSISVDMYKDEIVAQFGTIEKLIRMYI